MLTHRITRVSGVIETVHFHLLAARPEHGVTVLMPQTQRAGMLESLASSLIVSVEHAQFNFNLHAHREHPKRHEQHPPARRVCHGTHHVGVVLGELLRHRLRVHIELCLPVDQLVRRALRLARLLLARRERALQRRYLALEVCKLRGRVGAAGGRLARREVVAQLLYLRCALASIMEPCTVIELCACVICLERSAGLTCVGVDALVQRGARCATS